MSRSTAPNRQPRTHQADQIPDNVTISIPERRVGEVEQILIDAGVSQTVIDTVLAALRTEQDIQITVDTVVAALQNAGATPMTQFGVAAVMAEGVKDSTVPAPLRFVEENPGVSTVATNVLTFLFL